MCSITGCFDLLERRTQEDSLSLRQPARGARDAYDADLSKWGGRWRGERFTLYTIVTRLHLHTESRQAAVGLVIVHVSARVCVETRRSGEQSNHTQINPPVARGSRGYMCLMVKGRCMYTQRMINY